MCLGDDGVPHYVANGGLGGGSGIFFLMAFFDQKNDGSRFLV